MIRATFAGFTTAFSAIQANQKRLDITGQNLANMNTPGYTRQQLKTSSMNYTHPISHYMNGSEIVVGFGVNMEKVTQIRDPYLDAQYRSQIDKSGYTEGLQTGLDRLADVFDETNIQSLHQAFLNVRSTLENAHDPSKVNDPIYESELRSKMQAVTNLLNDAATQLTQAEQAEFSRLNGDGTNENGAVEKVNNILQQIGTLNRQIKKNQIVGQQSLELMDERNLLLDELASYIPIEVTYYKDMAHDGIDDKDPTKTALKEIYDYDGQGNIIGKKEWPDDLRVEMVYQETDANGATTTKRLTLIEGTAGKDDDNYGKLEINKTLNQLTDTDGNFKANEIQLTFNGVKKNYDGTTPTPTSVTFLKDTNDPKIAKQFPPDSGSIQASLDMLWKDGETKGIEDVKGYQYYRNKINTLAKNFAEVINSINVNGNQSIKNNTPPGKPEDQFLLANRTDQTSAGITAANISINSKWSSGEVHLGHDGDSVNSTALDLLEAMSTPYPATGQNNIKDIPLLNPDGTQTTIKDLNLEGNSFADYMNHISTVLANDSSNNQDILKTNVTVLNGIQDSRDSVSGISLDEEASNMMMYMSAYNAASRLLNTLDEALNILINNTGLVGR